LAEVSLKSLEKKKILTSKRGEKQDSDRKKRSWKNYGGGYPSLVRKGDPAACGGRGGEWASVASKKRGAVLSENYET